MSYTLHGIDVVVPSASGDTRYLDTPQGVQDCSSSYFSKLAGAPVSVRVVTMNGPAGGNPMVDLIFETEEAARFCMTAYCDGDKEEAEELYFS